MSTSETITRTDFANILNDILPVYNSTGFTVEKFTASSATSVSANGGTAWIQVRIPSGYEPVWVIGYYLNGGSGCSVYNETLSSDSNGYYASFALRNGQSTVNSVKIEAFVLCKQSLTHFTQAMADYIVEQGTSGIWTYRKWNSGLYEAWTSYDATGLTLTTSSAGTYYSPSGYKDLALPSFSLSVTNALYSNRQSQSSGVYVYDTEISGSNLRVWYRAHASASNVVCGAYFEIKGTWK